MSERDITGRSIATATATANKQAARSTSHTRWLDRATRVISRLSRSTAACDSPVRQHINRALAVMEQTEQSETAFVVNQRGRRVSEVRGMRRLAARILRRVTFQ